jgi:hypothetical protein
MNLGRKPQAKTWEKVITDDQEDELFAEGTKLYEEHGEDSGEITHKASRNSSGVEGDFLVLRNATQVLAVCEIGDDGELDMLDEDSWPQNFSNE